MVKILLLLVCFSGLSGVGYTQNIHSKTIIFRNDPRIKRDYDTLHNVTRYVLDTSLLKTGTLQIETCEKKEIVIILNAQSFLFIKELFIRKNILVPGMCLIIH